MAVWFAGIQAAEGKTVVFGIHGSEEVGSGFVVRLGLLSAPMPPEAVAKRRRLGRIALQDLRESHLIRARKDSEYEDGGRGVLRR